MLHRQIGKLMTRSADDASVAILISDVANCEKRLEKLIDSLKHWKEAIANLLMHQKSTAVYFKELYAQIPGGSIARDPSDEAALQKAEAWVDTTTEMRAELMNEVGTLDAFLARVTEIKGHMKPVNKSIKKREDRKLDYERWHSNVESGRKKSNRTERDNAALSKAETNLNKAKIEYDAADALLKEWIPEFLAKVDEFVPFILYAVNHAQYAFLSQSYTITYQYAEQFDLHVDTPDVHGEWFGKYEPMKEYVEGEFFMLREGKAIHQPMALPQEKTLISRPSKFFRKTSSSTNAPTSAPSAPPPSYQGEVEAPPGLQIPRPGSSRPASRRSSTSSSIQSFATTSSTNTTRPEPRKIRSTTSTVNLHQQTANLSIQEEMQNHRLKKQPSSSGSWGGRTNGQPQSMPAPANAAVWKINGKTNGQQSISPAPSYTSIAAAAKKKPPPPPPPKKKMGLFVVALYDFAGQSQGDLPFREGDRIKVITKTENTDEWWEGELNGLRGLFPANYCQTA